MAKSMSHKFGEMLGGFFENAMRAPLAAIAKESGLFLDATGERPARKTKLVTWEDAYGSSHNLDYVFEKDGTRTKIGQPVAFIELAWRRYTKHSKNKVQEIAGSILPIVEKHKVSVPFYGVILGGEFTEASLCQLRYSGFKVLHFPYAELVKFFKDFADLDISFDEHTSERSFQAMIRAFKAIPKSKMEELSSRFVEENASAIRKFSDALRRSINRKICSVRVLPLHGTTHEFSNVADALSFICGYNKTRTETPVAKFEISICFTNDAKVEGTFTDKGEAMDFLDQFVRAAV